MQPQTKAMKTTNESTDDPAPQPDPEVVAICAYYIWEQEGRPDGCQDEHWLRAELHFQHNGETPPEASKS